MLRLTLILLLLVNALLVILETGRAPAAPEQGEPQIRQDTDPVLPNGIHLVSELEASEGVGLPGVCFTVGPLADADSLASTEKALAGIVPTASRREIDDSSIRGYWVYLPPAATLGEADALASAIREAGIADVEVIVWGEWVHSVSLGFFANESNARQRKDELNALGFEAVTRVETDARAEYWLDYEQAPGDRFASLQVADAVAPELHRQVPCALAFGRSAH